MKIDFELLVILLKLYDTQLGMEFFKSALGTGEWVLSPYQMPSKPIYCYYDPKTNTVSQTSDEIAAYLDSVMNRGEWYNKIVKEYPGLLESFNFDAKFPSPELVLG